MDKNKWSPIINSLGVKSEEKKNWLNQYIQKHQLNENKVIEDLSGDTFYTTLLPIAKKISAKTIAGGEYVESEERIERRKRVQKLKRILDSKSFSETVSDDEYEEIMTEKKDVWEDGLIPVKPLSAPTNTLFYMDYKYKSFSEQKREEREKKLKRILNEKS